MNGEQAAASLFGPEDPASDPFATLGSEPSPAPQDDFFSSHIESKAPNDSAFHPVYDQPSAEQFNFAPGITTVPQPESEASGWYDQYGQWQQQQQQGLEHNPQGASKILVAVKLCEIRR
jgi:hypothetical protein